MIIRYGVGHKTRTLLVMSKKNKLTQVKAHRVLTQDSKLTIKNHRPTSPKKAGRSIWQEKVAPIFTLAGLL